MKLIIYGIDNASFSTIKEYVPKDTIVINDKYLNYKIEDLINLEIMEFSCAPTYVIYHQTSQQEVLNIIESFKGVGLKTTNAMTTQTNMKWSLQALKNELDEENRWFKAYDRLQDLLKYVNQLRDINTDEKQIVLDSYVTYMNQEKDVELLNECSKQLENMLNKR